MSHEHERELQHVVYDNHDGEYEDSNVSRFQRKSLPKTPYSSVYNTHHMHCIIDIITIKRIMKE